LVSALSHIQKHLLKTRHLDDFEGHASLSKAHI
jgi:hypothetical protein